MLVRKELLSPEWAERILSWPHSGFNVHSGRGPRLCLGIHFRRTRPWIRTRASGEPKARPWQPGPGQDEDRGRAGGEIHAPAGARPGTPDVSGTRWQSRPHALSQMRQLCRTHGLHECGRMKVIAFLTDFSVVDRSSPGVIDMFPALIYASVRWRDGIIDAKTRLQPA